MLKLELENEIRRVQKQLQDYRSKKKKAENKQRELNTVIPKLRKKTEEIEGGLQETLKTIERRLNRLNPKSKFKVRHLEQTKGFLQSSNASSAIENIRDAERKAKKEYLELDDKISGYNSRIYSLEQEIDKLQTQLKQMGA